MKPTATLEKLRVLLPHWIEHNRSHEAEFRKWADLTRLEGAESLAALLDEAATGLAGADKILREAQTQSGGPNAGGEVPPGHRHNHHH